MTWRAGTASAVITPDEPLWLAGYAARTAPANGKISDLNAKALALEDEAGSKFVLVTVDLIAVTPEIFGSVAFSLMGTHGIPPENTLVVASHTHYGPEIRPDKATFFNIPPDYARRIENVHDRVLRTLRDLADRAVRDLRPARLLVRQTSAPFADNRRAHGDVVDHDVPVLEVRGADDDRRRAVVFGYACHNTTIPPEDGRYCGDWAGFAQARIEADNPGCTALFVTGAAADQNPHPRGSVDLSRRHGDELADAVAASLVSPGRPATGRIRAALERIDLPLQPVTRQQLDRNAKSDDLPVRRKAEFLLRRIDSGQQLITSYDAPIQVVRLGDALLLVALGGEPVNDYAHRFKREFAAPGRLVWVAGYCNDMFGYLPTQRIQREGGYEGGRANLWSWIPAPFDETVEDRVVVKVREFVKKVTA